MRTSSPAPVKVDVAIAGGGLAGNLLARQLRRTLPGASIALLEKTTEPSFKVGESLVEIASNYLIRRQGLQSYLYEHHLPKNGLRYFFDDPDRSAPLEEMSEIGTINMPFHPAFQIDRARLEADLLEMNRDQQVQVRTGARVRRIELGSGGAPHHLEVTDDDGTTRYTARWLIDTSGRAGLIARQQNLRVAEESHCIGAVWGRFEGVAEVDELGSDAFRARVRHTCRRLSTLHFWYPGYWIWFIPLRGGITSVGIVGDVVAQEQAIRTPEGFRAFLDRHRAVSDLLAGAKRIDLGSYVRIAYGASRFFHPDRWGLSGEAATSADPFYSPGSDFIALENDFLTDLVRRDLGGESAAQLAERFALYDGFMRFRHEAAMLLYRGMYPMHASYELMRLKWDFDIGCYYNLWVSPYFRDEYLDLHFLRRQLRQQEYVLQALRNFAELFLKLGASLHERGLFHRCNRGRFSYGLENIDFVEEVGMPRTRRQVLEKTAQIFNDVRRRALELLDLPPPGPSAQPLPLTSFMTDQPLG